MHIQIHKVFIPTEKRQFGLFHQTVLCLISQALEYAPTCLTGPVLKSAAIQELYWLNVDPSFRPYITDPQSYNLRLLLIDELHNTLIEILCITFSDRILCPY